MLSIQERNYEQALLPSATRTFPYKVLVAVVLFGVLPLVVLGAKSRDSSSSFVNNSHVRGGFDIFITFGLVTPVDPVVKVWKWTSCVGVDLVFESI
jgi:hypothetical protein